MKPLVLHHQVPRYTGQRLVWPAGLTHLPKPPQPTTPQGATWTSC